MSHASRLFATIPACNLPGPPPPPTADPRAEDRAVAELAEKLFGVAPDAQAGAAVRRVFRAGELRHALRAAFRAGAE